MALVGPDSETYDKRFVWLINGTCQKELLFDGCRWAEGPVWFRDAQLPDLERHPEQPHAPLGAGRLGGSVSVFRANSNYSNGNTRDREGRLVSCEHGARRVSRTEYDGSITVIADSYKGKRLNSPNDVVVKSDGTIWFTDPSYGIMSDYEGHKGEMEQDGCYVYRVDPKSGKLTVVVDDFDKPNGLAFSPDESILYVADSAAAHEPEKPTPHPRLQGRQGQQPQGRQGPVHPHARLPRRLPGRHRRQRLDQRRAPAIDVFAPDGDILGRIKFPQIVSNLVFGGFEAEPPLRHLHPRTLFGLRDRDRCAAAVGRAAPARCSSGGGWARSSAGWHCAIMPSHWSLSSGSSGVVEHDRPPARRHSRHRRHSRKRPRCRLVEAAGNRLADAEIGQSPALQLGEGQSSRARRGARTGSAGG